MHMKFRQRPGSRFAAALVATLAIMSQPAQAVPTSFLGTGADSATLAPTVNAFRSALGGVNAGECVGACIPGVGRREINWDGVPDALSSGGTSAFPGDFFNAASGAPAGRIRGIQFSTPGSFEVSADSDSDNDGNPGPVAPLFGNHDSENADDFAAFSPQRIFGLVGTNIMDVTFSVPGAPGVKATSRGFAVVFTDVELTGSACLTFYGLDETGGSTRLLDGLCAPPFDDSGMETFGSFSFAGMVFEQAEVARVRITNGGFDLKLQLFGVNDATAMDDFIYGEPVGVNEPATWALWLPLLGLLRRRR